jgi:hypothetical protein
LRSAVRLDGFEFTQGSLGLLILVTITILLPASFVLPVLLIFELLKCSQGTTAVYQVASTRPPQYLLVS